MKQEYDFKQNFTSSHHKLTESLIRDLYNGQGDVKLLLLSDQDLLKFNERLHYKEKRAQNGQSSVFQSLYDDSKRYKEHVEELRLEQELQTEKQ